MDSLLSTETTILDDELLPIEVGDTAKLTEGQGGGQSEDKRRAYNC
ncbi:albusnodin family lasso peptide [Streptomyces sp. NPDC059003]